MKHLALAVVLLASVGMMDALYLSLSHRAGPVPCHVTRGCNDVLSSRYSEIAGFPISWFGFAFYLTALSCGVFESTGTMGALKLLFWPSVAAFAVSVGLVGIQAFVLRAFCEYCLLSAGLVTAVFGIVAFARSKPQAL